MTTYTALDLYMYTINYDIDNLILALNQEEVISEWHIDTLGFSAPHHAAYRGDIEILILFLDKGCDINLATVSGTTLLIIASALGHLPLVEILFDRGAGDSRSTNSINGETPLCLACANSRIDVVRFLLQKGVDTQKSIHSAILSGSIECLKELIEAGADIESKERGLMPLQLAAIIGKVDCCALLLQNDATIEDIGTYEPRPDGNGVLRFDCRPKIEKERRQRRKLIEKSKFDAFIDHHIEYQPYKDHIARLCYPLGILNHRVPDIGFKKAKHLRDKYYFDELLFYVHLHVAQVCTRSLKKCSDDTVIVASECTDNFASESNKCSLLMTVLSAHLKEFLKLQTVCSVCSKVCRGQCSRCTVVYYCSASCQSTDWPEHKLTCKPASNRLNSNLENQNNDTIPTEFLTDEVQP